MKRKMPQDYYLASEVDELVAAQEAYITLLENYPLAADVVMIEAKRRIIKAKETK